MQVETINTFKNYLSIVKSGFLSQDLSNILGAFFIKQLFHSPLLDMNDYSQLGAACLVGVRGIIREF